LEAITITLNGREVSGHSGMTIMELARESGIYIPTLCSDPNLVSIGACRICIVEDELSGRLFASCVTPIAPGMVINTESPRVINHRENLIKLMLASHPDTCIVCDKGNRCQLRQIASDMGIGWIELQRIPQLARIEEVNPFIERDLSKCILCAKCIRADQELVVVGAIDYINRGFISKPAALNDLPLENSECTFCGTCVAMCPTGALSEKRKSYRGAISTTASTICPYCGCGCGITFYVKDNRIVRAVPDMDNSLNHSTLCVRGSYGYDFVHSQERLVSPLIKENGEFVEVSWEKAIKNVAEQFTRINKEHGSDSMALFGSSKCTNEENYLIQKFARCVLGTNNVDNGSRLYNAASVKGLIDTIGFPCTTSMLEDIEKSDVIVVIGANPSSSAPLIEYTIKRAVKSGRTKLILIDPLQTKLSAWAEIWLKPAFGTDMDLINGISKSIVEDDLINCRSVEKSSGNFPAFVTSLKSTILQQVEDTAGVSIEDIKHTAQLLADAKRTALVYGNGITQYPGALHGVIALANLALMIGSVEDKTTGIYALQRENNGQGACDIGALPDFLPGYMDVKDIKARNAFGDFWKCRLPSERGLTALEMIEQAKNGALKGMYIIGENMVSSFPQPARVKEALESLEFLVVQDMYLTETAKLATVVLPAASFAEKEGTFTNFEGRVQKINKVIEPVGDCMADWHILTRLANKMGSPMKYTSPQQVMNEIIQLFSLMAETTDTGGKKESGKVRRLDFPTLNRNLFNRPSGKSYKFMVPDKGASVSEKSNDEYPFNLIAGSTLFHFGSGTRSSKSMPLMEYLPDVFIAVNKQDAKNLHIEQGDKVKVLSSYGEADALVDITNDLSPGTVFMPISFPHAPVYGLFSNEIDIETGSPALKMCTVKLERIEVNE
jgi:formate dehydrogenase alpha subunit